MSRYEKGMKIIEERFCNKDNVISLATIDRKKSKNGAPMPMVRDVDAMYDDCAFYITTYGKSNKMAEIAENNEVAFSVHFEWFSGKGTAENLGWIMAPQNAELRTKLRTVFAAWYDDANNEQDENCCILKINFREGVVIKDHGAERYVMDFVNQIEASEGK